MQVNKNHEWYGQSYVKSRLGGRERNVSLVVLVLLLGVLGVTVGPVVPEASAATARTSVWVGSPAQSTWPTASGCSGARYPSANCSLPSVHHTFFYGDPYRGDVGWDLQNVANGQEVRLYAAPNNTNYNNQVTAHVLRVLPACAAAYSGESTSSRVSRGGYAVVIEIRHSGTKIGTIKYVHIQPSVSAGQTISRWGSLVGRVGTYRSNPCWSGRHIHMELMNYANYACYNKGWKPGQQTYPRNFVGFIGGAYASSGQKACP